MATVRTFKLVLYDEEGGRHNVWTLHCDETSDVTLDEVGTAVNEAINVIIDEGRGLTSEDD